MSGLRVVLLLVGLFGLFLLVSGLLSLSSAGAVPLPGFGQKIGGSFLIIVSLIITVGAFAGFVRMKRR